jgi:hypothetical protein
VAYLVDGYHKIAFHNLLSLLTQQKNIKLYLNLNRISCFASRPEPIN